jgi:hypothetical protein
LAGRHRSLRIADALNQFAKFLARFEEGNLLRWHLDSGASFWVASDARSSLARVEASESADLNFVPGSQGADDAVKYSADDEVGFLQGHPNGSVNLFGQIGPGHLAHSRRITKKSITVFLGAPGASSSSMVGTRKVGRDGDLGGSPGIGFVWRYDLISVVMLPARRRPQVRAP